LNNTSTNTLSPSLWKTTHIHLPIVLPRNNDGSSTSGDHVSTVMPNIPYNISILLGVQV